MHEYPYIAVERLLYDLNLKNDIPKGSCNDNLLIVKKSGIEWWYAKDLWVWDKETWDLTYSAKCFQKKAKTGTV